MSGLKYHGNASTADRRQRIVSRLLALLFLAYVLLSGLAPGLAAAQDDIPIQLQALCHSGPESATQGSDDAPADALPCCTMCCGAAQEGASAPPLALDLAAKAPLPVARHWANLRPLAPHSHRALPQPARGPPALI